MDRSKFWKVWISGILVLTLVIYPSTQAWAEGPEIVPFSSEMNKYLQFKQTISSIYQEWQPWENPEPWAIVAIWAAVPLALFTMGAWASAKSGRKDLKRMLREKEAEIAKMAEAIGTVYRAEIDSLVRDSHNWRSRVSDLDMHLNKVRLLDSKLESNQELVSAFKQWKAEGSLAKFEEWLKGETGKKFIKDHPVWVHNYHEAVRDANGAKQIVGANYEAFVNGIRDELPHHMNTLSIRPLRKGNLHEPGSFKRWNEETNRKETIFPDPHHFRQRADKVCAFAMAGLSEDASVLAKQAGFFRYWGNPRNTGQFAKLSALTGAVITGGFAADELTKQKNNGKDIVQLREEKKENAEAAKILSSKIASHEGMDDKLKFFHEIVAKQLHITKPSVVKSLLQSEDLKYQFSIDVLGEKLKAFESAEAIKGPVAQALSKAAEDVELHTLDNLVLLLKSKDSENQELLLNRFLNRFYTELLITLTSDSDLVMDGDGLPSDWISRELKQALMKATIEGLPAKSSKDEKPIVPAPGVEIPEEEKSPLSEAPAEKAVDSDPTEISLSPVGEPASEKSTNPAVAVDPSDIAQSGL